MLAKLLPYELIIEMIPKLEIEANSNLATYKYSEAETVIAKGPNLPLNYVYTLKKYIPY